jgi:hypothetical protein
MLPSVSEELAMAAQLAPPIVNESAAERATMAESQPAAAAAAAAAAADDVANGGKRHQIPEGDAPEVQTKRRRETEG